LRKQIEQARPIQLNRYGLGEDLGASLASGIALTLAVVDAAC
jgi:hypothetical protein